MVAAYEALSPEMKKIIEPLHMVHSYEHGRRLYPQLPPLSKFEKDTVPPVSHPLVRVQPLFWHEPRWHAGEHQKTSLGRPCSFVPMQQPSSRA